MRWPVLFIGIVLVAAVLSFAVLYGPPASQKIATTTQEIIPGIASISYENTELGFTLQYPANAGTVGEGFTEYLGATGRLVKSFLLPEEMHAGTNLLEAGLYVGHSSDAKTASGCGMPARDGERFAGTKSIRGTMFSVFTAEKSANGETLRTISYRVIRGGGCYELVEFTKSSDISRNPDGNLRQFDRALTHSILEAMVNTFTFVGEAKSGVEGQVQVRCLGNSSDEACLRQIRTIEVYQDFNAVALFKTDAEGRFRAELPSGKYELRVSTATSTKCASVGIVVPEQAFISTNISCDAGGSNF